MWGLWAAGGAGRQGLAMWWSLSLLALGSISSLCCGFPGFVLQGWQLRGRRSHFQCPTWCELTLVCQWVKEAEQHRKNGVSGSAVLIVLLLMSQLLVNIAGLDVCCNWNCVL